MEKQGQMPSQRGAGLIGETCAPSFYFKVYCYEFNFILEIKTRPKQLHLTSICFSNHIVSSLSSLLKIHSFSI